MFCLESRRGDGVTHGPLRRPTIIIGRGEGCDVVLEDPSVSRRHLRLTIEAGRVAVEDLGSSNGMRVDGRRVESARLELDRWSAAGGVARVVRRGLTLTSRVPTEPPAAVRSDNPTRDAPLDGLGAPADLRGARAAFERQYFAVLLRRCDGNVSEAARVAGLTRTHFYNKLMELRLRPEGN
jgi:DNA-binding NtrC family response regulator